MWRQKGDKHSWLIGIVQNEQPSLVRAQPIFHCLYQHVLFLCILLGQVEQTGNLAICTVQRLRCVGTCPEHRLIFMAIQIRIFNSELRFANAAQAADRLGLTDGRGLRGLEVGVQLCEQIFASCKERVA